MKDGRFKEALSCLDKAKGIAPIPPLLFLRAQYLLASNRDTEADSELADVESLLKDSPEELKVVQGLRKQIKWKRSFNGFPNLVKTQDVAVARGIMEAAAAAAVDKDAKNALSEMLTETAMRVLMDAQEGKSRTLTSRVRDVNFVLEMLSKASHLDPSNENAKTMQSLIRERMLGQLR